MLNQTKADLSEMEKTQQEHLQSKQHWQNQFYDMQKILENKTMESASLQAELKMALQRLKDTEKSWQDTQYQLKLLADEKWIVAQEKAQLEGQLKQMQKMIAV